MSENDCKDATTIVTDGRTLRALEKLGMINEPPPHVRPKGKRWGEEGYYYVDDSGSLGVGWQPHLGREFRLRFIDGCFFPFVEARERK